MTSSPLSNGKYSPSAKKSRGLISDHISDMLTRIRNASLAKKSSVRVPLQL